MKIIRALADLASKSPTVFPSRNLDTFSFVGILSGGLGGTATG